MFWQPVVFITTPGRHDVSPLSRRPLHSLQSADGATDTTIKSVTDSSRIHRKYPVFRRVTLKPRFMSQAYMDWVLSLRQACDPFRQSLAKGYAMSPLCASQLMHSCLSATVCSDASLRDAAERILTTGLDSLPVTDDSGRFVGLIAQSVLIRELLSCGSSHAVVASIVSHHVDSARPTASLASILPLFRSAGVTMIPVIDKDDYLVGLIHRRDVIRHLLEDIPAQPVETRLSGGPVRGPYFLRERRQTDEW